MAGYNQRMNKQLYQAASDLSSSELEKNLGAFFGSIMGTLNHIVVGDVLWLSRFSSHSSTYKSLLNIENYPKPNSLDEKIYSDFNELYLVRAEIDKIIIDWVGETSEDEFENNFLYRNSQGIESNRKFGEVVSHLFNHQTHHRGQVTTLLCQNGRDVGSTDYIIDVPNNQA